VTKPLADIAWEGDSKDVLSSYPNEVKSTFGFSLRRLQNGELPRCGVRPMASVGKGVWELKTDDARTWYRVMYLSQIQEVIYVLHAFEKNSTKTDRRDIEIAKDRLKAVQKRLREREKIE
jgi:phage-related protein